MTHSDDRVASEMGRALLAIYRAGLQVKVWPDALRGRAGARIVTVASARRRHASRPAVGERHRGLSARRHLRRRAAAQRALAAPWWCGWSSGSTEKRPSSLRSMSSSTRWRIDPGHQHRELELHDDLLRVHPVGAGDAHLRDPAGSLRLVLAVVERELLGEVRHHLVYALEDLAVSAALELPTDLHVASSLARPRVSRRASGRQCPPPRIPSGAACRRRSGRRRGRRRGRSRRA